jgi:CDGSH-type Zn-finger protein
MSSIKETENRASTEKNKIRIQKEGPYLVFGKVPLIKETIISDNKGYPFEWKTGDRYPIHENYTLCRCGESQKKPFCDVTHVKINFNGYETATQESYLKQAKEINGPTLMLTDAKKLCASAGFCYRKGGTWNLTRQSDNPEAKKTAIDQAEKCPSGRLVAWDKKTKKAFEPKFEKSIGLVEGPQKGLMGPIWVRGNISVESANGTNYEIRNRVTLCRCGTSSNKPFCDGNHLKRNLDLGIWRLFLDWLVNRFRKQK